MPVGSNQQAFFNHESIESFELLQKHRKPPSLSLMLLS